MTHPDLTGEPTPSSFSSLLRPALAPSALHGLPGDIVRALAPHTEADPAALLLTFLAMFGCAVGGGPHDRVGSTPHPARLFVLIVGDAATARKGTAGDVIEDLMRRAEPEWHDERIHRGIQSAEALIRLVDDGLSHDRRLMVVESEFGRLLSTLAQRGNLSATIKDAYDGKPLHVTVRNENRSLKATRPHISIVGHVQPGVLVERLPEVELFSGFANRFLFAVVNRSQLLPSGGSVDEAVLDGLADRIHDAVDSAWEFASPKPTRSVASFMSTSGCSHRWSCRAPRTSRHAGAGSTAKATAAGRSTGTSPASWVSSPAARRLTSCDWP
jgi:Protein of unknown function (DUF3987)